MNCGGCYNKIKGNLEEEEFFVFCPIGVLVVQRVDQTPQSGQDGKQDKKYCQKVINVPVGLLSEPFNHCYY